MQPVVEADHGRIEIRAATVSTQVTWLNEQHQWPGLKAVGKVVHVREMPEKVGTKTAYYLLSMTLTLERLNEVVRQHWAWKTACTGDWM
jgi:predicted transposase YbfD/YdcC